MQILLRAMVEGALCRAILSGPGGQVAWQGYARSRQQSPGAGRGARRMAIEEFPTLLRSFRERSGRSCKALAHEVGVDPSYLTRIEHGDREPPRQHIVEALARALRLSVPERDRLQVAAGYAPMSVVQLGAWDDALQAVVDVLNDVTLSPQERLEFRSVVVTIAARYTKREVVIRYPALNGSHP